MTAASIVESKSSNLSSGNCDPLDREPFEAWLIEVMGYDEKDLVFEEHRNCYRNYPVHLAFKSWLARGDHLALKAESGETSKSTPDPINENPKQSTKQSSSKLSVGDLIKAAEKREGIPGRRF